MSCNELIESLVAQGVLKSLRLIEAFKTVDRAGFVRQELKDMAYENRPLPIGSAQTISQPYTVAFMLELLKPNISDRVLDVGSGSGWTTAILACVSKHVDAVERIEALVAFSKHNLSRFSFKNIKVHLAGQSLGLKGESFDKILVSCAADKIPESLLQQLNPGGIMVIPVKNSIVKVSKNSDGSIDLHEYPGFVFVPLITDDS